MIFVQNNAVFSKAAQKYKAPFCYTFKLLFNFVISIAISALLWYDIMPL